MRDSQRSRVYEAERPMTRTIKGGRLFRSLGQTQDWIDETVGSEVFRTCFPGVREVSVTDGRGRRRGGARFYRRRGFGVIKAPRFSRRPGYLCHELAHLCADSLDQEQGCHGPVFAACYLILVEAALGIDARLWLGERFVANRVRVDAEVWATLYRSLLLASNAGASLVV